MTHSLAVVYFCSQGFVLSVWFYHCCIFATLALVVYGVGNWGCGAFNGDKLVKAVVQLLACSAGNVIQVRKGMVWDSGAGLVG